MRTDRESSGPHPVLSVDLTDLASGSGAVQWYRDGARSGRRGAAPLAVL